MARTIKILHVLHSFSSGGLENGVVNIINHSPDHIVHELCLLSRSGEFLKRLARPIVFHELNKGAGNSVSMILRLHELFRKSGADIVHTRNWAAFDAVLAACLTTKPTLVHGEHGRDISDPLGLVYRRNLARRLLAFRAKKYVAVSSDLYSWLQRTVRIPKHKLAFIPNGVDTERFCPGSDPELRTSLGIGADEFVVGTIGRLDPIKNHEGIINAIGLCKGIAPNKLRLVIVGEGPNRPNVERKLKEAALTPQPLLLGDRLDVARFYRLFDAFVLNSFAEGMSNTLLEAMASGVPVICTSVGGNAELISDCERGVLVNAGDDAKLAEGLRQYIEAPALGARYALNARQFILENFSLTRMIERYVALYESVA